MKAALVSAVASAFTFARHPCLSSVYCTCIRSGDVALPFNPESTLYLSANTVLRPWWCVVYEGPRHRHVGQKNHSNVECS